MPRKEMWMKKSEIIMNLGGLAKLRGVFEDFQQELDELGDQAFLACPDLNVRRHEILQSLKILSDLKTTIKKLKSRKEELENRQGGG